MPSQPGLSDLEKQIFQIGRAPDRRSLQRGQPRRGFASGSDVYEALGAAIDQAQHHVHAEYYLIRNDKTGEWFRDKLVRAAERGVKVRLLCDAYGCLALGAAWRRPLKRAGAKVGLFLPMRSLLLQPVNLRNHRKIVVIDGTVRLFGRGQHRRRIPGADDKDRTMARHPFPHRRSRRRGPAARVLARLVFHHRRGSRPGAVLPFPGSGPGRRHVGHRAERARHAHRGHPSHLLRGHRGCSGAGVDHDAVLRSRPPMVVALQVAAMRGST